MSDHESTQLTRKEFIKLLIAGGTATAAASFLPGKWVKPIMRVGVLPAHAQGSVGITIYNLSLNYGGPMGAIGKGAGLASPSRAVSEGNSSGAVNFEDPDGGIDLDTLLYLDNEFDGTIFNNTAIRHLNAVICGTSTSGIVHFDFFMNGYNNGLFTLKLTSGSRESNEATGYLWLPD